MSRVFFIFAILLLALGSLGVPVSPVQADAQVVSDHSDGHVHDQGPVAGKVAHAHDTGNYEPQNPAVLLCQTWVDPNMLTKHPGLALIFPSGHLPDGPSRPPRRV